MKRNDENSWNEDGRRTVNLSAGDWHNGRKVEYDYYRLDELPGSVFSKRRGTEVDTGSWKQIPCERPRPGSA